MKLPPVEFYELKDWEQAFGSKAFKSGFLVGGKEEKRMKEGE